MNNEIIATQKGSELTKQMITDLEMAGIVPKGTPEAQIKIFAQVCSEKGLSPFSKEIYLVCYGGKYSVITGIDGFRKLADRTGTLAGCSDAMFDLQPTGQYHTAATLQAANRLPTTCTVTIKKVVSAGTIAEFTHTAVFKEFSSGQQKWQTMPFQMINKVAEAFALRKGFAAALSGINIEEEAAAIEGKTIEVFDAEQGQKDIALNAILSEVEKSMSECLTLETLNLYATGKKTSLQETNLLTPEVQGKLNQMYHTHKMRIVATNK